MPTNLLPHFHSRAFYAKCFNKNSIGSTYKLMELKEYQGKLVVHQASYGILGELYFSLLVGFFFNIREGGLKEAKHIFKSAEWKNFHLQSHREESCLAQQCGDEQQQNAVRCPSPCHMSGQECIRRGMDKLTDAPWCSFLNIVIY